MPVDHYCWMCHRECSPKLACCKCDRNFHLSCVSELRPDLVRGSDGLKRFAKVCPECERTSYAAKRWSSGQDFDPITRKTLNNLLLYIFTEIKKGAPEPFLWPSNRFRCCAHLIDVDKIEKRAKDNFYDSPRDFLNDVHLINHNCLIIWRYAAKLRIDRSISNILVGYDEVLKRFNPTIDKMVRFLEDCPHCIWNFVRCPEDWLTMACPWGHPLIVTKIDNAIRPAKMIKFNRSSGRVDIILFESNERVRVDADKCWKPCASDLDLNIDPDLMIAKEQALKYIETLKKRFRVEITFDKERRTLSALDKDFIKRSSQRDDADDIIELTDDESSIIEENHRNEDVEVGHNSKSNHSNRSANNREKKIIDNYLIDDEEVIDEVNGTDDSGSDKQIDSPPSLLTTTIERISPSPSHSAFVESSNAPTQVLIPTPTPIPTHTLIPNPTSSSTSKAVITQTSTSTPPPPMTPTPPPLPQSISEQFAIVSDDELDTFSCEIDPEPTGDDESSTKSLFSSEFVVEEEGNTLSPQFQPISPFYFSCIQEDTVFERTISSNSISNNSSSNSDFQITEPQSKKVKLDQLDSMNSKLVADIKRLEQQLEFAEKEKQLNLQQITEIQDQLKLTKQMEGTRLKTVELHLSAQINSLKDIIEQERKEKADLNHKLVESVAKGYQAIRALEDTNSAWDKKLTEELKLRDDQHKKEMDIIMEQNTSLKQKIAEREDAIKQLEQKYNTILPKYNKLSSKLLSLSQEFGTGDNKADSSDI